jgi:hypothetical protein
MLEDERVERTEGNQTLGDRRALFAAKTPALKDVCMRGEDEMVGPHRAVVDEAVVDTPIVAESFDRTWLLRPVSGATRATMCGKLLLCPSGDEKLHGRIDGDGVGVGAEKSPAASMRRRLRSGA